LGRSGSGEETEMHGMRTVFTLSQSEVAALEGMLTGALQDALAELRALALAQYQSGRKLEDQAAVAEFQESGLALLRSDLVRVYHHVLERVAADAAVPTGEGVPPLTFGQG